MTLTLKKDSEEKQCDVPPTTTIERVVKSASLEPGLFFGLSARTLISGWTHFLPAWFDPIPLELGRKTPREFNGSNIGSFKQSLHPFLC